MHRALALAGLLGLLALAGCGKQDAGSASPAADSSATAGATTPATADAATIGPDGFGKVKLGASATEVAAAGLKVEDATSGDKACPKVANIKQPDGWTTDVVISTKDGVSAIGAAGEMHTPEGIKVGSPLADVKKAYPQLKNPGGFPDYDGVNLAAVTGNSKATYRISINNGKVFTLNLVLIDTDCVF